jgi:hypothetical protein
MVEQRPPKAKVEGSIPFTDDFLFSLSIYSQWLYYFFDRKTTYYSIKSHNRSEHNNLIHIVLCRAFV